MNNTMTATTPGPVAIDFETYYDKEVSIKPLGVDRYLRHPKAEIYLVSVVGGDGEEFVGHPDDFDWSSLVGRELWSHNAAFDRRVYHYLRERSVETIWDTDENGHTTGVSHENYTMPDLETPLWKCTANLAVYFRAGRSLKAAVAGLLNGTVSKDVRDAMKGLTPEGMRCRPSSDPQFATFFDEVCAYALNDSRWCRDLALRYGPHWPEGERLLSDLTTRSCHRGIPVDMEMLETGKALLESHIWEVDKRLPWVTGVTIEGYVEPNEGAHIGRVVVPGGYVPTSPKGLAEACRAFHIPHPPSTAEDDARCIKWELTYGDEFPWVADMRERRKANILLKRATVMLDRAHDGWFPYGLKYGGAHTLRFSGDAGFNVQNFPKESAFGFDLRACVSAPDGYEFIIADYSQVEARITPYLAGDDATIELIRGGMSVYEVHARLTMGWTGGNLKKEDKELYALAKARVLALGFGCGWQRFRDQAQIEYGVGMDWPAKIWKDQVNDFRASNPKIKRLWNRLENDFRASLGGHYEMELPSNRVMTYFDVCTAKKIQKVEREDNADEALYIGEKTRQGYQARTEIGGRHKWHYGGLLCENLVQATARDVFAEALVELDRQGLTVLFHVHDEVTVLAKCEDAEETARIVEQVLSRTPDWLPGCPIGCEVNRTYIYEK